MTATRRWLPLLLLPVGVIGAALLCLWLAQNLLDRESRRADRLVAAANRVAIAGRLDIQLTRLRELTRQIGEMPDTLGGPVASDDPIAGDEPKASVARFQSLVNQSRVPGLIAQIVLLNAQGQVTAANEAAMTVGQGIKDDVALRALERTRTGGLRPTSIEFGPSAQWTAGWVAVGRKSGSPGASTVLLGIDVGVLSDVVMHGEGVDSAASHPVPTVTARLIAMKSGAAASSAQQERSGDRGDVFNRSFVSVPGSSPALQLQIDQPSVSGSTVFGALVFRLVIGSALLSLLLMAIWWRWIEHSLGARLPAGLAATLTAVADGRVDARSNMTPEQDPDGHARTLDRLLDNYSRLAASSAAEHEAMTRSIEQMQSTISAMASGRDLTKRIPSSSDVTGAVAEAVNSLRDEMVSVLTDVSSSSQAVAAGVSQLGSDASRFDELVGQQASDMQAAAGKLNHAFEKLTDSLKGSERATTLVATMRSTSGESITASSQALAGLEKARTHIRMTEKRVKGLGERSLEIGGVVRVIAELAERTGILALNASLQAAAAGAAGRQFSPIAQEVKRLADSASEATDQASTLVQAIRDETRHATEAMNAAIAEVVTVTEQARLSQARSTSVGDAVDKLEGDVAGITDAVAGESSINEALAAELQQIERIGTELVGMMHIHASASQKLQGHARDLLDQASIFQLPPASTSQGSTS